MTYKMNWKAATRQNKEYCLHRKDLWPYRSANPGPPEFVSPEVMSRMGKRNTENKASLAFRQWCITPVVLDWKAKP